MVMISIKPNIFQQNNNKDENGSGMAAKSPRKGLRIIMKGNS